MHPRLLREEGRSLQRLDDEIVRDVTWKPEVDGRVDERLHDQEDVRRAGTADRGGHSDHLLVIDFELDAEGAEQRGGLGALIVGRLGRGVPDGHALSEPRRGVWHATDHLVVAQDAGQGRGRGTGKHAQDELACPEVRADLATDLVQHLWLDPEQDHVRVPDRLEVRCDGPDPVLALKGLAPFGPRMAGDDLARGDQLATQQAGDHRLGHDAGADRNDCGLGKGGHGGEYTDAAGGWRRVVQTARAAPFTKNRPVTDTSTSPNPAPSSAAVSSAGS